MKQQISPLLFIFFLLVSCQQESHLLPEEAGKGYLSLSSIELQAETIRPVTTRAVSPDLTIEIVKEDGTTVAKYEAGAAEASEKIELEAGIYKLKAYSPNYGTTWTNDEKGEPIYYKEQDFTIEAEKVRYLTVQVPMVNFGVRLLLPDNFNTWFSSYLFSVQMDNRNVTLQNGETAYFAPVPETSISFQYALSATNADDEALSQISNYSDIAGGTIYEITYSMLTRSLVLRSYKR